MLYEIKWSNALIEAKAEEDGYVNRTLCGYSTPVNCVIVIREDLPPDSESDTLLHEILHQCLAVSGCEPNLLSKISDIEERVVVAMTGPLLGVLRANPAVYKYLIDNRSGSGSTG